MQVDFLWDNNKNRSLPKRKENALQNATIEWKLTLLIEEKADKSEQQRIE